MSYRILHVLDHSLPLQSGYAFRTAALLREQRAFGWETFHLTTPKHYAPGGDEETTAGLHFYRTRVSPSWARKAPVLDNVMVVRDTAARLEELVEKLHPDIIHAHSPCLTGMAASGVARRHGIPLVYEMRASWEDAAVDHGTTTEGSLRYKLSRALESRVLRRADAITTICEGLAGDIAARGISRERITLIPNAVDIESFEPIERADEALRRELGLGDGPVLGFIGSFYGYEGIDMLVRAMPEIVKVHPNATALLVGGGYAEASLKQLVTELGMASKVRFAGRVPHDQVRRYYSVVDVLVYARKSMRLTELVTPLKPLEAMALKRLFVCSGVGGHRELIPQHLRQYVFTPGDVQDLVRATLQLLADRDKWPAFTDAGRRYVAERVTWRNSAARYRDVYESLVRVDRTRGSHGVSTL
jgi:PEP-CTERM/exosortase A-associated glycosyltransferase